MDKGKIKERKLIISLHEKGKSARDIADLLGTSKSKAAFWVSRFKKSGSLEDKPRSGRPTKLNKDKLKIVRDKIKLNIVSNEGYRAGFRSKEALQIIEFEAGRTYTLRHAQRVLHKLGFSLVTPRPVHVKRDKEAQESFQQDFKKSSRENIWAIQS